MVKNSIHFPSISEEELLQTRICNLPLHIKGTWLEECVNELYQELDAKGIVFKPECYLADEWLTPEGETCIGIPFYLAHPTLIKLEKKFMDEAEGEGKPWCMKLLRHEAGHAISYAYRLLKRKHWERVFGSASLHYGSTYKYHPYSKRYVRHLDGYYAQYHPEEDFVETFAVWLTPNLDWKTVYKGWKALGKLYYVDKLMQEIKNKPPIVTTSKKFWRQTTLRLTLQSYYKKKRYLLAEEFPDFHDKFLRKVFGVESSGDKKGMPAYKVIRQFKPKILDVVSRQSGEKRYVIHDILRGIEKRARDLKIVSFQDESTVALFLSTYVTSLAMNYMYTGHFRGKHHNAKET
jgi:hypothetical protein